jgi:polar amino acid transport system substrate-binding protein
MPGRGSSLTSSSFARMRLAIAGSAAVAAVIATAVYLSALPVSTLDRARESGTIRIGYVSEAPFSFRTAAGEVTGESPEIAQVIVQRLGIPRVEWVHAEFRSLIPELLAGRFDIIAAGMFVTPVRKRMIRFSTPTYAAHAAFLVRQGDEGRIGGYEKLRDAGGRVALLAGAYEQRLATAAGIPPDRILVVADATTGMEAVRSGSADAFAITAITARRLASSRRGRSLAAVVLPDSMIAGVPAIGRGAFGFRPSDRALREAFDAELLRFLGSPEHHAIGRRFGLAPEELPRVTVRP